MQNNAINCAVHSMNIFSLCQVTTSEQLPPSGMEQTVQEGKVEN